MPSPCPPTAATSSRSGSPRAGAVDDQPGFEGFELLRPTDERTTWLVITRWADEESFEAWKSGQSFENAHRGTSGDRAGERGGESGQAAHSGGASQRPVGMSAELWSFDVATRSDGTSR
ncbi:antibiotic biosynthesis monooxygenase family protein [Luteipulveratus flavus]|uniref:antibiotic biosynthesis monooxygenase family protein n=1 Tax=Luteipulveratus flavus TaxID=3031728 RepID=UPI003211F7DC